MNELNLQNKTFFRLITSLRFETERGVIVAIISLPTIKKQLETQHFCEGVSHFKIFTTTHITSFQTWQREDLLLGNFTFTSFECIEQFWKKVKYSPTQINRKKILNHE